MKTQLLLGFVIAAASTLAMAQEAAPLTRAEVRADLEMWQRSGMAQLIDEKAYDPSTPEAQHALAEYERLRAGPGFRAEVMRLEHANPERHAPVAWSSQAGLGYAN